jgi:hypothetical protein
MKAFLFICMVCLTGMASRSRAALPDTGVVMLPMTCSELLPEISPYLNFFEAVARGNVAQDRSVSKRVYRILLLREKISVTADRFREQNPVDTLIRKTLCFYREQKEPLKPTPYDDAEFLKFLRGALKELELKVEDAVYDVEYERQQRHEYERQLLANQGIVERVKKEADVDAERTFERLTSAARKKVKLP